MYLLQRLDSLWIYIFYKSSLSSSLNNAIVSQNSFQEVKDNCRITPPVTNINSISICYKKKFRLQAPRGHTSAPTTNYHRHNKNKHFCLSSTLKQIKFEFILVLNDANNFKTKN